MSTAETTRRRKALLFLLMAIALTVMVGIGMLLQKSGPGNMGTGFLSGAGVAIFAALIMAWRVTRAPVDATTFERAWTSHGDERDDAVLTRALAVIGVLSLPLTGVASIAIGLGVDVAMALTLLMAAELLTGVIAFAVTARRI
ncbi:MAG: hypothetical protein ACTHWA_02570 [Arachnia sp.]